MTRLVLVVIGLAVGVGLWIDAGVRSYAVDHRGVPGELTVERRVVGSGERPDRWWEGRFISTDGQIDRTVRLEALPGDPEGAISVGVVVPARWVASDPGGAYRDAPGHYGRWLRITLSVIGLAALVAGLVVVVRRSDRTFARHAPTPPTALRSADVPVAAARTRDANLDVLLQAGAREAEHLRNELERARSAGRAGAAALELDD